MRRLKLKSLSETFCIAPETKNLIFPFSSVCPLLSSTYKRIHLTSDTFHSLTLLIYFPLCILFFTWKYAGLWHLRVVSNFRCLRKYLDPTPRKATANPFLELRSTLRKRERIEKLYLKWQIHNWLNTLNPHFGDLF